jgi:hypothetical protein
MTTHAGDPADISDVAGTPGETPEKRLTRNLNELLQELRVTQTGAQILTGFLLTLPFTSRFGDLDQTQRNVYLAVFVGSVVATGLIVTPVALHRMLFRRGERPFLVAAAHNLARAGLLVLGLTTSGVVWLIFDVVVTSRVPAFVATGASLVFLAGLWIALPLAVRGRDETKA